MVIADGDPEKKGRHGLTATIKFPLCMMPFFCGGMPTSDARAFVEVDWFFLVSCVVVALSLPICLVSFLWRTTNHRPQATNHRPPDTHTTPQASTRRRQHG